MIHQGGSLGFYERLLKCESLKESLKVLKEGIIEDVKESEREAKKKKRKISSQHEMCERGKRTYAL